MGTISLTLPSDGQTIDASDVNNPLNTLLNEFNGNIDDNNIKSAANISGTKLLVSSMPANKLDSNGQGGWVTGILPAVLSVTENGNRSADITFASTVANILTPGMRIRTTRTVAAPTYMGGAFNGTNHYFTKATPTGTLSTVTDNFTIMAWIEPTAQTAQMTICGRSDAAGNNSFVMRLTSVGCLEVYVQNGGGANFRILTSVQTVPINRKTHVAITWATGTVVMYIDGVSVPVQPTASTGGTAPTTAGTGGDFSIGRPGANNLQYFTGYISGVGVFNAVLSAATIRSYRNQALTGSETNCIGAWSLNNTANDQNAAANNLTATNSVGYTSGRSPYTLDATNTAAGTFDWGIVTKVSTTVATVNYPEGCAIPTSGGISSVEFSNAKAPFGMPTNRNRWRIENVLRTRVTGAFGAINQWTGASQLWRLTVPAGDWIRGWYYALDLISTVSGLRQGSSMLADAAPANGTYNFPEGISFQSIPGAADGIASISREVKTSVATATDFNFFAQITGATGSETFAILGDFSWCTHWVETAWL